MKVIIKTEDDIAKIKKAVSIWKIVRQTITENIKVGMSLDELDQLAKDTIISNGGTPTFYLKYGFPKNICISVNDCVIHGVPSDYKVKAQDKITFDMGVTYENHVCDAAFTLIIGENPEAEKISAVCKGSLLAVKEILKPGVSNWEIAAFMQEYIETRGYHVLRDFTGHGCGNDLHEDPSFPNYVDHRIPLYKLRKNMVICLEPMILTDSKAYEIDDNGWSVIAQNHKLTCHWEDMFLITENGCELLTD